jgi:signal transduction histidine kinase/ligand-binding sensor domain-containing protein/DNA-binding response OmpR family regulator
MAGFYKAFIFFLTFPLVLYSQSQDIKFERISVEQGLSHAKVFCILQDSKGFMWFGTKDGLNKYDGYKFTVYRHDPADSSTLSSNSIRDFCEDQSSTLWIATNGGGINSFDRETERFTRYTHDQNNPTSISNDFIHRITSFIYGDREIFWIGTGVDVNKFDPASEQITHLPFTDKGYPESSVEAMVMDSAGNVWIGSWGGGLYRFDPVTRRYTNFSHDPEIPHSLSDNEVESLFWDRSGILWVGTFDGGLNRFDPENNKFIRYQNDPNNQQTLSSNFVVSIFEDRSGILWLGTAYGGLNAFDYRTEKFNSYLHDPGEQNSISDNTVNCTFEDKSGVLWVGTWGGVNKIDPRKTQFVDIKQHPGDPNSLSGNYIWSICESNYGGKPAILIGTKTDGLNILDRTTGIIMHYKHDPDNPNSIPSNFISALCEDRSGILWIGTYGDGLIKYDRQSNKFFRYENDPDDPGSISGNIINCIFEDSSGLLWIGTQGTGLNRLDKKTEQFTLVGPKRDVRNVFEDRSGTLWIAGNLGLKKLDRTTEQFTTYQHNPEDPSSISNNSNTAIHESSENGHQVLWVGTNGGGLNRFDPESEKFKNYTVDDGLPNNIINGILEDEEGNLWLSTNDGLSKFNPRSEIFRNYDVADGLLGNQFNFRVCCKTKDGQMFFGGARGLNAFYPDRLTDNHQIPEIVITDIQIFNEPVGIMGNNIAGDKDNYLLEKHISEVRDIELSYRANVFSFEFATLDYRSPQKNQYAYKMEGVDPDWVYTGASRRFATYTQLDPGEYVFKVKGSNNDGIWNEEGTSIKIIITPPWWKTNFAYFSYFILLVGLIYSLRRYDLKRQKLKQQLEMEHFESDKLREVDKLKSRFFANISHEFRTPLTLIKGPVKQIMDGKFTGNLKEQCEMILRNSNRLLGLINQILDLSKLESGEMKLQVSETHIIKYLKGMVLSFASLAERKNINLQFKETEKSIVGFIDCDKLEKIVTNLLSNAFKFTSQGGEIEVTVEIPNKFQVPNYQLPDTNSNFVEISITNTSAGIAPEQLGKIFDRFYQTNNSYTKDGKGSGIGLALTKELVEIHHGTIIVTSIQDKKTTFNVILPVDKAHYKEDEIIDTIPSKIPSVVKQQLEEASETVEIQSNKENISHKKSLPLLLIVEDNPDVTSYICSFLDKKYRIITAENGKEGLKKAIDKYPDLIISDIMMPEMDGFELCEKVKSDTRTSHIPVILLTARADMESKIEGLEFGADDYVTKPFEARELQSRSKNLIEQRRKLREKFRQMNDLQSTEIAVTSMDKEFLNRLMSVFETHISEPEFSTEQCAKEVGMSRSSLNRKLQALTNLSTHEFIRTLRLKRAALLLRKAAGSVTEIAYAVGFNNMSHFSKVFREQFGQLPSVYANKINHLPNNKININL